MVYISDMDWSSMTWGLLVGAVLVAAIVLASLWGSGYLKLKGRFSVAGRKVFSNGILPLPLIVTREFVFPMEHEDIPRINQEGPAPESVPEPQLEEVVRKSAFERLLGEEAV